MLKIIVLIPLILSALWLGYLKSNGYSLAQGKQGFTYILIISLVIAGFYTLMLYLTHL
ncbi:hypothetical protein OCL06_14060 [Alteromonas sp. ASW11-19]|uniref:Succinyl-diaminopimelate desuccinylase n=1 Tax=Alteromonas salexigens TaxID=2982530 RepID=A0ABT2VQW8_9ALTE|nr:hypothetical protein [Alteromonas salexigens]MCU7555712.1 hypothetical protein [Alteromonas salexigens]